MRQNCLTLRFSPHGAELSLFLIFAVAVAFVWLVSAWLIAV